MVRKLRKALVPRRVYQRLVTELRQHSHREMHTRMNPGGHDAVARQGARERAFIRQVSPDSL